MATRSCNVKVITLLVALTAGIGLLGCVPGITFDRSVYSDKADINESISIRKITDNRDPTGKSYKAQADRLGTVRGGYGNPFAVNVKGGGTVADEVGKTVTQALTQCGYTVTQSGAPALEVIISDFWCDGMIGYKVSIDITLNLIGPDGSSVLYTKQITDSKGFAIVFSYGEMEQAYNGMMNVIGVRTAEMAKSKDFIDALQKAK